MSAFTFFGLVIWIVMIAIFFLDHSLAPFWRGYLLCIIMSPIGSVVWAIIKEVWDKR